jgi:hypothetical protein
MSLAKRVIRVDGEDVSLDTRRVGTIKDVDKAQRQVSAEMAWWASVWGAAEREYLEADAYYRHWRAQAGDVLLKSDPKMAEWKVKQAIEAHEDFYKLKQAIAKAKDHATTAEGIFKSMEKKSNLAQSIGAKARSEFERTGRATRSTPTESSEPTGSRKSPSRAESDDPDGKKKLKEILKKRSKRDGD